MAKEGEGDGRNVSDHTNGGDDEGIGQLKRQTSFWPEPLIFT